MDKVYFTISRTDSRKYKELKYFSIIEGSIALHYDEGCLVQHISENILLKYQKTLIILKNKIS